MSKRLKFSIGGLIAGVTLPVAAQEQNNGAAAACKSMGPELVLGFAVAIFALIIIVLVVLYIQLNRAGWSLANAISEPTHLSIPLGENWAQSQGDNQARIKSLGLSGPPRPVTLMEASTSRLIALAGTVAILMIYVGFGIFSLYTFGLTCQMPASTVAVSTFLYSGLTLFAPYVANKLSGRLPAQRPPTPPQEPVLEPLASIPQRAQGAPTRSRPQEPPVSSSGGSTPPHRHASAATIPPSRVSASPVLPAPRTATAATAPPASSRAPAPPPYQAALRLIAEFEGFVDHAYPDPASGGEPWTIGYGFTTLDGRPVQPGDTISQAEADAQLLTGVQACARHLAGTIPYWISMAGDQRCALISFAWNLGEDFYGSAGFNTISSRLGEKDWNGVPAALLLYCDPGTSVSAGLLRRRQAEADLWNQGMASLPPAGVSTTAAPKEASHPNPLNVPWFDQLNMSDGQGWRDCFSASTAMLAAYWGKEPNEDDYNVLRESYGDSTSSEAQLAALRHLGLKAEFRTDGCLQTLRNEIDAGRPVAVGWLHHGPPTAPSGGGHWTVVIGYDDSGVIMNDPYGSCDLVNGGYPENHNGAHQHYSYANWEPRWRPQGSGGWYLVAQP